MQHGPADGHSQGWHTPVNLLKLIRTMCSASVLAVSACGGDVEISSCVDGGCPSKPEALAAASITLVEPVDIPADSDVLLTLTGMGFSQAGFVTLSSVPCLTPQMRTAVTLQVQCTSREAGVHMLSVFAPDSDQASKVIARMAVTVSSRTTPSHLVDSGTHAHQCFEAGSQVWVACDSQAAQGLSRVQEGMKPIQALRFSTLPNAATGRPYALEDCIKDERTSLVWEGKAQAGWRAGQRLYTHYDRSLYDPFDLATSEGNTGLYVAKVKQALLCGFDDWRLPRPEELQGLLNYGVAVPGPLWPHAYFPNTPAEARYWTATPYADSALLSWYVDFASGVVSMASRQEGLSLRLVRGPSVVSAQE